MGIIVVYNGECQLNERIKNTSGIISKKNTPWKDSKKQREDLKKIMFTKQPCCVGVLSTGLAELFRLFLSQQRSSICVEFVHTVSKLNRKWVLNLFPVLIQCRFNVHTMSSQRYGKIWNNVYCLLGVDPVKTICKVLRPQITKNRENRANVSTWAN